MRAFAGRTVEEKDYAMADETTQADRSEPAESQQPDTLEFATDKGASRSTWIAAFILLLVVGWMGSGFILPNGDGETVPRMQAPQPVSVVVSPSEAAPVTLLFTAEGQAMPDRDRMIVAEASGEVASVSAAMGDFVEEGAEIARLRSPQAEAELARAEQEVARTERDLENAETLLERGVATLDRVQQARSAFAQAQAQLTAAEEALADLIITAPFAGRIEMLDMDTGEYVQAGSQVVRLVDNAPLTVSFQVPQQSLTRLESGQSATVRFITGEELEGEVSFVGTAAAQSTRTFLAEVRVPNEDGAIAAGISARITIPTAEVSAHLLAPFIVSLSPDGQPGVKTVDDDNVVQFHPIEVVRAEIDGIWVTGLPDSARLITIGQGFVSDGETVRPQLEETDQ